MKFYYINNILVGSQAARGRQVFENTKVFGKLLGKRFVAWSADSFFSSRIYKDENNVHRKMWFHLHVLFRLFFRSRNAVVYSRNLSILFIANALGYSVVWEAHDLPKSENINILSRIKEKLKIVCISEALALQLKTDYQFKQDNILVAHDAVDIELYDMFRSSSKHAIREKFNLPKYKKMILHSGSVAKERGTDLFKIVLEQLKEWDFVQVGGNAEDLNRLKEEFKTYKNFVCLPHQDNTNLIQLQLSADALFYMITKETSTYWCCSPMKIFEFLASGKPIVASNIGSLNEIINSDVAFVYNQYEEGSLLHALTLLKDEKQCKQVAEKALSHVRKNFTWALRAEKILEFLKIKA